MSLEAALGQLIWARADPPDLEPGSALEHLIAEGLCGGVTVFDVPARALREATARWQAMASSTLFIAIDNERGPGQQLRGMLHFPPLMALAAADSPELCHEHGRLTALHSRSCGVNLVFAPVLDVYSLPSNPIVGARSLGCDPERVAELGVAVAQGLQAGGVLACGKHFPGHGDTAADSHISLPEVTAAKDVLEKRELVPFRAAAAARIDAMMTAHVAYRDLDGGRPATVSKTIVGGLLREELGFDGLVITDALCMGGVGELGETEAALQALQAGCDVLLLPSDVRGLHRDLCTALANGRLEAQTIEASLARLEAARSRLQPAIDEAPDPGDFAMQLALQARTLVRPGSLYPLPAENPPVVLLLSEAGRTGAPDGGASFGRAMAEAYPGCKLFPLRDSSLPAAALETARQGPCVVALFSRVGAYKGSAGLLPELQAALADLPSSQQLWCIFGPPSLTALAPADAAVLLAYGSDGASQIALAEALLRGEECLGVCPV